VSVIAPVVVAEDDGAPVRPAAAETFVDRLVARLHAEYGVPPEEIRSRATEVLATFATAPVRTFVPILVEKRLRQAYRNRRRGPGTPGTEPDGPDLDSAVG
jgi:hypothetical protein